MTITVLLMSILTGQNHTVVAEYDTPQACEAAAQAHQKVLLGNEIRAVYSCSPKGLTLTNGLPVLATATDTAGSSSATSVQYVPLDASSGYAGWPYRAGRQHDFHDSVRRIRKPRSVLVQPCDTNLIVIIEVARLSSAREISMSQDQPTSTTRRGFLGAATIATAATAATLTASPIAQGEQADEIRVAQTPTEAKPTPPAAPIAKEGDWSKPAAMAIPKGGAFKQEQGRYGLIYPRTPANYGFSILAKVKPGREAAVREYGNTIEKAVAETPDVLAPLKLHYLRWLLFEIKGDTYFMYQGIFDTDFDKYIEDAVALFASTGITTVFTNLEGFPENWQGNVPAMEQVFPGTPMPQLSGVCGIPLCDRR